MAGAAQAATADLAFTSSDDSAVVGGPTYTPQATSPSGAVSFTIDQATTNSACTITGTTVSFGHAGSCVIDAADPNDPGAGVVQQAVAVAAAGTATTLAVAAASLTATVVAGAPGGGTPSGTVLFSVGGRTLGSVDLVNGVAELGYAVPANVTEQILATYQGDADYQSSSDAQVASGPDIEPTFVAEPTIAARLTSSAAKNRHGWWHTPVRVHFTCSGARSPIIGGCPHTVVLDRSGQDLTLTRSIRTAAGHRAAVTLRGIKIDLTKPRVRIVGVRNRTFIHGTRPAASCAASDRISGIASCRLATSVRRGRARETITYTATAISRAGVTGRATATVYAKR